MFVGRMLRIRNSRLRSKRAGSHLHRRATPAREAAARCKNLRETFSRIPSFPDLAARLENVADSRGRLSLQGNKPSSRLGSSKSRRLVSSHALFLTLAATLQICTHSPSVSFADRANCQASATPKNASKGESQPKHFFGLRLIDKTIFCKVSLSKE